MGDLDQLAAFYDFVEMLCPAPRFADLFSRHNEKWDCQGDEAPPAIREAGQ